MRAQTVAIAESTGRVLSCTIFKPGGKKLLAKGHVLSEDDVRLLETEGMAHVWVAQLEQGEIGEDEAVLQVGRELGCGCLEIRLAAGGRADEPDRKPYGFIAECVDDQGATFRLWQPVDRSKR